YLGEYSKNTGTTNGRWGTYIGSFSYPDCSGSLQPEIEVDPASLSNAQYPDMQVTVPLTISNVGTAALDWDIFEENPAVVVSNGTEQTAVQLALPAVGTNGSRGDSVDNQPPIAYLSPADFSESFDDITNLPGWAFQNNSDPLGTIDWFQGNDTVFVAHSGVISSYIATNFNNTSGTGTISNWMMTPELNLSNGDTLSFWTRTTTGSTWPDRLQVRLSTAGSSTNVGAGANDVGDFTTLLLDINETLTVGGFPEDWTQFTVTLSDIPAGATGRLALHYYVANGGPTGSNSNYIGIDTLEYTMAQVCDSPADIPWVSVSPLTGTTTAGTSSLVDVTFDSASLATGVYTGTLCVNSNDAVTPLVVVPLELTVEEAPVPAITLTKTVGTDAGVCATTDEITVSAGTTVYYCYEVMNTGNITLSLHDLEDDALGVILDGFIYDLAPGASVDTVTAGLTLSATIDAAIVNTATWTAYNAGPSNVATATATATVHVDSYTLYLPVIIKP
ncbi:MAG: choice-of-anchor J domain-containing protein, partial [Anaerolineales bacterium]|nr:choice-of-anchor J domain-containing protein [Anaerolineales bacterium]